MKEADLVNHCEIWFSDKLTIVLVNKVCGKRNVPGYQVASCTGKIKSAQFHGAEYQVLVPGANAGSYCSVNITLAEIDNAYLFKVRKVDKTEGCKTEAKEFPGIVKNRFHVASDPGGSPDVLIAQLWDTIDAGKQERTIQYNPGLLGNTATDEMPQQPLAFAQFAQPGKIFHAGKKADVFQVAFVDESAGPDGIVDIVLSV